VVPQAQEDPQDLVVPQAQEDPQDLVVPQAQEDPVAVREDQSKLLKPKTPTDPPIIIT
jgi:hypothetical protein